MELAVQFPYGPSVQIGPDPVIEIRSTGGVPGPPGEDGEEGPPGPPGDSIAALSHVHTQATPAAVWNIHHALPFTWPSVTVWNSAGDIVEATVTRVSSTHIQIESEAGPFSGTASLS